MYLIFNELSFFHKPINKHQAISILLNFVDVCSKAKRMGFKKMRIESNFWSLIYFENDNISSFLSNIPRNLKETKLIAQKLWKKYYK